MTDAEIEALTTDNTKLAYWLAGRFARRYGTDQEETEQRAIQALVKAANAFDPGRDKKFSSLASAYIGNELRHMVKRHSGPTLRRVDLDAPVGEEGEEGSAHDAVAAEAPVEGNEDTMAMVHQQLAALPERDRSILTRWIAGETYREIAADQGMTFVHVGNIIRKALAIMKQGLADQGVEENLTRVLAQSILEGRMGCSTS